MEDETKNLCDSLNRIHGCNGQIEITRKTVILMILSLCVFFGIGLFLSCGINEKMNENDEKYESALRIRSNEEFRKALSEDAGYAFVEGYFSCDGVSHDKIDGKFLQIGVWHERHVSHTRTSVRRIGENTKVVQEHYKSWDNDGVFRDHAKTVKLLDVEFPFETFNYNGIRDYKTNIVETGEDTRDVIQTLPSAFRCTVFCCVADNSLHDAVIYYDKTIDEVYDSLTSPNRLLAFWLLWGTMSIILSIWAVAMRSPVK